MSKRQVIETIYGKYSKFEVVRSPGDFFSSTSFYIWKDGKPWKGSYSSLKVAVEVARKEAG